MAAVSPIDAPETEQLRTFYARVESTSGGLGILNVFKEASWIPPALRRRRNPAVQGGEGVA